MDSKRVNLLFYMGLMLTAVGVLALYVLELEMQEMELYITKMVLYLSALATIFFGWKKIDHKFPGKGEKE